jgi:hypothetical protein
MGTQTQQVLECAAIAILGFALVAGATRKPKHVRMGYGAIRFHGIPASKQPESARARCSPADASATALQPVLFAGAQEAHANTPLATQSAWDDGALRSSTQEWDIAEIFAGRTPVLSLPVEGPMTQAEHEQACWDEEFAHLDKKLADISPGYALALAAVQGEEKIRHESALEMALRFSTTDLDVLDFEGSGILLAAVAAV